MDISAELAKIIELLDGALVESGQWPDAVEGDGLVDVPTGARVEKGTNADAVCVADD